MVPDSDDKVYTTSVAAPNRPHSSEPAAATVALHEYTYPRHKSILTLDFLCNMKYTYPRLFPRDRVSILVTDQNGRVGAPDFRRACFWTRTRCAGRRDVVAAARARRTGGAKKYTYPRLGSILTLDFLCNMKYTYPRLFVPPKSILTLDLKVYLP